MNLITDPIKKLTTLGTHAAGAAALGAKAGIGVVEQIVRTATGGKHENEPTTREPAKRPEEVVAPTPATVAKAQKPKPKTPKPKAPAKKQGDALADAAGSGSDTSSGAKVHPLLADEHIEPEEEVVYSSGPDIEEPIETLLPKSDDERI